MLFLNMTNLKRSVGREVLPEPGEGKNEDTIKHTISFFSQRLNRSIAEVLP